MSARKTAEEVVRKLREAGHETYFAGGCVRDMVMGREPEDYDIATSASPEVTMKLFPQNVAVGAAFGVVLVRIGDHEHEVATFRADGPTADERRPISVTFCSAREDVMRRDFTINGMLYDPVKGEVLDWVGGQEDIRTKLIRTIGKPEERFAEDRLRMLRAVRFASGLDFAIEQETYDAIRAAAANIVAISVERIRDEIIKILTLPEGRGGRGVRLLRDTGLLQQVLPEIVKLEGVEQPPQFHPEGDVFEHTCMMLDMARDPSPELALGILLHDVGKPQTQGFDGRIRFDSHDKVGAEMARQVCARLRMSNDATGHIYSLVAKHMRMPAAVHMRVGKLKQLLALDRFEEHLELHRLDCLASHRQLDVYEFLKRTREQMPEEELRPPPLITGADLIALGLTPGPIFATILEKVKEKQLDGELTGREQALELVKAKYLERRA